MPRVAAAVDATEPLAAMAPSAPSTSSSSKSFAAYLSAAKRQRPTDQRASVCSTASTTSSSATRASDASSSRSSSRRGGAGARSDSDDDAFRGIASSLARHETAVRRRALLQREQEDEQDPDFLPSDSQRYKLRKKRRARRIRLKHYGLAKQAAKLNNLSGFLLHSITPRESSILTYTSMATPGTHTEYDVVVENFRAGLTWQVSRRYSSFRLLRDELARPFQAPHCHYCASITQEMQQLDRHFPGKRLWGSSSPTVVRARAERFQTYLRGLLAIATAGYTLNCPLVAGVFVVQLRTFLTADSVRFTGIPGQFGQQIPSLLHELSVPGSPHDAATLQTIQEHSSRSSRGSVLEDADDREKLLRRAEEELDHHFACSNNHACGIDAYLIAEDDSEDDDDDMDTMDDAFGDNQSRHRRM